MMHYVNVHVVDALDQRLIALLRADGRAPIAQIAAALHVSRGTAQNRLDRLIQAGVILGFTVRVRPDIDELCRPIGAFCLYLLQLRILKDYRRLDLRPGIDRFL